MKHRSGALFMVYHYQVHGAAGGVCSVLYYVNVPFLEDLYNNPVSENEQ